MAEDISHWHIEFSGCAEQRAGCHAGHFRVVRDEGEAFSVEVRVTEQIEGLLARQIGRRSLTDQEREAVLSVAGQQLIKECLSREGRVEPVLLLTSEIFRHRGAERQLLRECSLL